MSAVDIDQLIANTIRWDRAVAGARRFIRENTKSRLPLSDVEAYLRRRRDPLPPNRIKAAAEEAMRQFLNSPANRYRGGPAE